MNRDRPRNGWNGRPKQYQQPRRPPSGRPAPTAILPPGRVGPARPAPRQNYPPENYPPQSYPPRVYPPQSYPAGGYPPEDRYQPDAYPPDTYPPDSYPPDSYRPVGSPPPHQPHSPQEPRSPQRPQLSRRPSRRGFRWGWVKAVLVVLVVALVGFSLYVDSKLTRVAALKGGAEVTSEGTNWLIVGSDSRADLSEQQEQQLATGNAVGARTDTIMLLHTGSSGTVLMSLPRDSFLTIPGHGRNKLNAAFSLGGPQLLVRTVEGATGLNIDHYAEIGFGGFVDVVNAVGGVDMCIPSAMKDPKAGLNLKAGCQELDGETALGYVRTRATPRADLDRIDHQRQFLSALMKRVASPATVINPFRLVPLVESLPGAVTLDSGDHVWHLLGLALAMKSLSGGDGLTTTVPISGLDSVAGQSVVRWDTARTKVLFGALAKDQTPPKSSLG